MMLKSLRVRLVRRSISFSLLRRRTPVSCHFATQWLMALLTVSSLLDVIVLTAMGEQAAIEAKEAPRG